MSRETTNRTFDELASGLASGSISRRRALRLMGAALVGGTLASLGIREASADEMCKAEGKKCRKDEQCCSGNCQNNSCLPPTGPNLTRCLCQDNTFPTTCTSVACGPALLTLVCDRLCATHGGRQEDVVECQPEPGTLCPG